MRSGSQHHSSISFSQTHTHLTFIFCFFSSCVALRQMYALTQTWASFTLNFFTHIQCIIGFRCVYTRAHTQLSLITHLILAPFMLVSIYYADTNNVSVHFNPCTILLASSFLDSPLLLFSSPSVFVYSFILPPALSLSLSVFLPSLCTDVKVISSWQSLCIINEQLKTHSWDN